MGIVTQNVFFSRKGSSFFSVTSPVKCKTTAPIKSSKPQGIPGSAAPCTELQLGECGLGRPSKSQNAEKSSRWENERKSEILTWITPQKAAAKRAGNLPPSVCRGEKQGLQGFLWTSVGELCNLHRNGYKQHLSHCVFKSFVWTRMSSWVMKQILFAALTQTGCAL